MKVETEDDDTGETVLGPIEDEVLLNEIFEIFKKNHADEFNFE